MNTAAKVNKLMQEWKAEGLVKSLFVVRLANACIGWSYVFGAAGELCTPVNRRRYYNSKKKPTIKSKCKNFEGTGSCSGCRWHPGGNTRFFDCRGFTRWLFEQIGIKVEGGGCTSQYNDDSNWAEKGLIERMPRDKVCIVFRYDSNTGKYEHTLLYDGDGHYIHDNGEVRKISVGQYKATHYAIPKGLYDAIGELVVDADKPHTEPVPDAVIKHDESDDGSKARPTLRKGDKGSYVRELQKLLIKAGCNLARYGADGDFGNETLEAVKIFQKKHGLTVDGVVGKKTWNKLLKFG